MKAFLAFALAACFVLVIHQTEASPQFPGVPDFGGMAGKFTEFFGAQAPEKILSMFCQMQDSFQQACGGSLPWSDVVEQASAMMKQQ